MVKDKKKRGLHKKSEAALLEIDKLHEENLSPHTQHELSHIHDRMALYLAKYKLIQVRREYRSQLWGSRVLDWLGVFMAIFCFVFVVLWAASPDSENLSIEEAFRRALVYSVPIAVGMYGVSRVTRRGSSVPAAIASALPYVRPSKDGGIEGVTMADQTPAKLGSLGGGSLGGSSVGGAPAVASGSPVVSVDTPDDVDVSTPPVQGPHLAVPDVLVPEDASGDSDGAPPNLPALPPPDPSVHVDDSDAMSNVFDLSQRRAA